MASCATELVEPALVVDDMTTVEEDGHGALLGIDDGDVPDVAIEYVEI